MNEFSVGQKVMHIREGLSEIVDSKTINDRHFFVVKVCRGGGETIYVPIIGAENIIRPIMSVEEADNFLKRMKKIDKDFNTNTKQRRDYFKKCLSSGEVFDMLYLYHQYTLYTKYPDGVKLGPTDIDMLEYATNFVLDELSLTYQTDKNETDAYVQSRLAKL